MPLDFALGDWRLGAERQYGGEPVYGGGEATGGMGQQAQRTITGYAPQPKKFARNPLMGQLYNDLMKALDPSAMYRKRMSDELWRTAEPRYAAAMGRRGLTGSTAYTSGLADLSRNIEYSSYMGGEELGRQYRQEGMGWAGMLSPWDRQGYAKSRLGISGSNYGGTDYWGMPQVGPESGYDDRTNLWRSPQPPKEGEMELF